MKSIFKITPKIYLSYILNQMDQDNLDTFSLRSYDGKNTKLQL